MAIQYEKKPKFWWQSEKLHTAYKEELKELKKKYKKLFQKKYGKKTEEE